MSERLDKTNKRNNEEINKEMQNGESKQKKNNRNKN